MRLNHSKTCNNKKLSPHSQPKQTSIKAFTLAETLTTLMIIGIVAALIMPAFTNNINNHIQQKRNATAIYKLSQITDKMKAAGDLDMIFSTTDEFVDIMAKHTKIAQRCDANNINNCFKTLMINNQKSPIKVEVKDLKTGEHLGRNKWKSDNVGIVF